MKIRPTTNYRLPITNFHGAYGTISTLVVSALQIHPFLTNKANFRKSQMSVTDLFTREYERKDTWSSEKNKPNSKPIQTQFKANSNPKQSQFKPKTKPTCRGVAPGEAGSNPIFNYSCVFELDLYNLLLHNGNLTIFNGDFMKWQMHQKQMQ